MKTIAVAPKAADLDPVERSAAAMIKQSDSPAAEIINKGRLPKRSTVCDILRVDENDKT